MMRLAKISMMALALSACATDGMDGAQGPAGEDGTDGTDGTNGANGSDGQDGPEGPAGPQLALPAVYTLSNPDGANQVSAYLRATTGSLSRMGRFDTGGAGTGGGLGSQGALVFDAASQRFFAVNTGDDTLSMLELDRSGQLTEMSTVDSGGSHPVSVTVHDGVVYVANQGDTAATPVNANISGFRIMGDELMPIAGSTRPLSGTGDVRPTDIAFSPDGRFLVVAERFANKLSTFAVTSGVAQAGSFQASAGMQPFAFDWSPEGYLVVAEVGPGVPDGSSVSSYAISAAGALTPVTSALETHQTAACWLVVAGGFAYVANAASATITGVSIAEDGQLTLRDASGVTAATGAGAIDLALTPDRGFLYSLAGNPRAINVFEISSDGGLTARPTLAGISASAAGLVAR
jgi:6-phosphogluconolactonase (cycloisomerase 2 family)